MRRIPRNALLNPAQNHVYAVFAVCVSVFVFAYSSRIGPIAILAYYALWLPLILIDYRRVIGPARNLVLPLALIGVMLASTLWSLSPGTSLRGAIQFATHAACALVAARVVDPRSLSWGLVFGCLVVVLYSLAFGAYSYDRIDGEYTFVGAFSSKNQLGLYSSIGIFFAVGLLAMRGNRVREVLVALAVAGTCAAVLLASRSATSVIALAVSLGALAGFILLLKFRKATRLGLLAVAILIAALMGALAVELGAADHLLAAFGKDPTLTGRTYLWSEGLRAGWNNPVVGIGYSAFWVHGMPEAERLWQEFYIGSRSGFHFHNTYVEVFVELGAVGLILKIALYIKVLAQNSRSLLLRRDRQAAIWTGLSVMILVRSFAEVDTLYPYTVGSFLLFYMAFSSPRPALAPGRAKLGESWSYPRVTWSSARRGRGDGAPARDPSPGVL